METTTTILLDRWKAYRGIQSDNGASVALHIERATVSGWRHGKSHANTESAAKMAEDLKLDVLAVLASIEADRARSPEAQRIWARFGKPAFMALLVGLALPGPPPPLPAKLAELPVITAHYAKSPRGRRRPIGSVNPKRVFGGWNEAESKRHLSGAARPRCRPRSATPAPGQRWSAGTS